MTYSTANNIRVQPGTALAIFMQAGFAMCETGFIHAKNTGNRLMKKLIFVCHGNI